MREQRDCDCAELTCIGEGDTCCEGERGSGALYLTATFVKALSLTGALLCPLQGPCFAPTGALLCPLRGGLAKGTYKLPCYSSY